MSAPPRDEKRVQLGLFCGLLLIFLAVWKGDGGYVDLMQYLDNTESLWLKGELSIPGRPGQYYIHPLGISVLSGPFVVAGAAVEKLSGGAVGRRSIAALSIPVFAALACVLLYRIGRELRLSPLVSLWGALMLALGSPVLNYTRFYFAEAGIALSVCTAGWAFLRARRAEGRAAVGWTLLAGAGLAGATACHFNNVFVSGFLWLGMTAAILTDRSKPRAALVAALTVIPVLAGGLLLYLNARRFGTPFSTGYEPLLQAESVHAMSFRNLPINIGFLGRWLLRVPWVIPAFAVLVLSRPREKYWAAGLALAVVAHLLFLQTFAGMHVFPIRYQQTPVIVLSVGLLLLGAGLWRRWRERGLFYSGLLLLLWNAAHYIRFDYGVQTIWISQVDQRVNCYLWYMSPSKQTYYGSPMGVLQWAVLAALLASGCAALALTARSARRLDDPAPPSA